MATWFSYEPSFDSSVKVVLLKVLFTLSVCPLKGILCKVNAFYTIYARETTHRDIHIESDNKYFIKL